MFIAAIGHDANVVPKAGRRGLVREVLTIPLGSSLPWEKTRGSENVFLFVLEPHFPERYYSREAGYLVLSHNSQGILPCLCRLCARYRAIEDSRATTPRTDHIRDLYP